MPINASDDPAERLDALLDQGRFSEAEELARILLGVPDCHRIALAALARAAAATGDRATALRYAGRARRVAPDDASLAALLGALLIAAGRADEAIPHLDASLAMGAGTEAEMALASARFLTGEAAAAAALVESLLGRLPVRRTPILAGLADQAVHSGTVPGWMALDEIAPNTMRIIGAMRVCSGPGVSLRIAGVADGTLFPNGQLPAAFLERFGIGAGCPDALLAGFALPMPPGWRGEPVALFLGEVAFLGAPVGIASSEGTGRRAIEGEVSLTGSRLTGWVRRPGGPGRDMTVTVIDERARERIVTAVGGAFHLDLGDSGLTPGRLWVAAAGIPLEGSPVGWTDWPAVARVLGTPKDGEAWRRVLAAGLPPIPMPVDEPPPRQAQARMAAGVDVVIPVYCGRTETMACIAAVLDTTATMPGTVVVIDDASPDAGLTEELRALAASGRIHLVRNPSNLGFPASANRGLAVHADRDAILLNADTLPAGDWWRRLRAAAYSSPGVGSATALSNDASILSYPSGGGPIPDRDGVAARDALAAAANAGLRVEIPTGVGFCWYLRRDCLDEVGALSETRFGRGYGEENDFCLRARRMGWRHVAAADVFVGHVGSRSFGSEKSRLLARNLAALNALHPGYDGLIRRFAADDPLAAARRRLDEARFVVAGADGNVLLLVTFDLGGGVARHVEERCRQREADGLRTLILRPHPPAAGRPARCRVEVYDQPDLKDLVFTPATEAEALCEFLLRAGVAAIEIHHLLNHDPMVDELAGRLGVLLDVVLHDYGPICPRITMIDGSGRFCGGPDEGEDGGRCTRCVALNGSRFGRGLSVAGYRARHATLLRNARTVLAPSRDAADRIRRHVPGAAVTVRSWDDVRPPIPRRPAGRPGGTDAKPWRICVIGAVGAHKGYHVLHDCARDAATRALPLEFILVGHSQDDVSLFATGQVFVTGPYREGEAAGLIAETGADLVFLPSVWPETWCYALSEAWAAGLPVLAFDLGAMAERIRDLGGGWLLPLDSGAGAVNDALLAACRGTVPYLPPPDRSP